MRDFLPVVECVAKFIRGGLEHIGETIDMIYPPRYPWTPAVSAALGDCPEAVSARTESAAPASGSNFRTPPSAVDDPVAVQPPAVTGSPKFSSAGLTAGQIFAAEFYEQHKK